MHIAMLLLVSAPSLAAAWPAGGSPACRCIQPWSAPVPSQRTAIYKNGMQIGVRGDYGASTCHRWEQNVTDLCGGINPPGYCEAEWCYVNASTCARPHIFSSLTFKPARGSTEPLAYSYETCGNLNSYDHKRHYAALKGKTLRLTYPGDYEYYTYTKQNGEKDGSHVAFIRDIAKDAGFTWGWTNISDASKAWSAANYGGSSYWACVHDIAINETDMCIGAFYVLPARRSMISFTDPLESLGFKLLVYGAARESFWELITKPFLVFTWNAWLVMAAAVFYVSCSLGYIQGKTGEHKKVTGKKTMVDRILTHRHLVKFEINKDNQ